MKLIRLLASVALIVVVALCTKASAQTTVIWTGGTGNWSNAALWSPAGVPQGPLFNVLIDNGNAVNSVVDLDTSATIGGLTIDAGDQLIINNSRELTLFSSAIVNNAGNLTFNSTGSGAFIFIDGNVTLQGAGKVTLGNAANNAIRYNGAPGSDTLNSYQTIEGRGDINVLFNNTTGQIVNANVPGASLGMSRQVTNHGTLRTSNGGILQLNYIAVANTGGTIQAQTGSKVFMTTSTIFSGLIDDAGGGIFSRSSTYLDGSAGSGALTIQGTYTIGNSAATAVASSINNNGQIDISSGGNLAIDGTVNLQGSGTVTLSNDANNAIRYNGAPGADPLNNFQTINGRGTVNVITSNSSIGVVDANTKAQSRKGSRSLPDFGELPIEAFHLHKLAAGDGGVGEDFGDFEPRDFDPNGKALPIELSFPDPA